uniref:Uncharacterized protein n=1 Tax=Brassica campestris TaxID=3711 RepID=A0A3P5YT55_BRACM|nr:unnamed protein product [Brassica rapa]
MENNIEELQTLICKSLGLPEGSKRNARKRKAIDDPQEGQKRKTVGTRLGVQKMLPQRRSGGGNEVTKVARRSYFFA